MLILTQEGEEITITYGDEKGACEMLFSYGFLEDTMDSAEMLFLSLTIPDDDNLKSAKASIAECAPGFRLVDTGDGEIDWTGDYIWLLCANEDDGFRFEIARTVDGQEEMQAFFGDSEVHGGAFGLHALLRTSELWDVYRLRAVTILQQRVFDQLQLLYGTQEDVENASHGDGSQVRARPYQLAMKLRRLEFALLESAYESFESEVRSVLVIDRTGSCSDTTADCLLSNRCYSGTDLKQKNELVESPVVLRYLARMNRGELEEQPQEDDFS